MDEFNEALKQFGKALGNLKQAYADEFGTTADDLLVIADKDNYVSILPNNVTGTYVEHFRDKVDTE